MFTKRHLAVAPLAAALLFIAAPSFAEDYPNRVVRIVSPYPAGSPGDTMPRVVADALSKKLGHNFIIENRPGATQVVGAQFAAKAPADGYTLFFGSVTSLAMNPSTLKSLPYDPINDFVPISLAFEMPLYLSVNPSLNVGSVEELVNLAKSRPGKLRYGSLGIGSSLHLAGALFARVADIDIVHVPYKGSAEATAAVANGEIDFSFDGAGLNLVRSGRLPVLAITSTKRVEEAPNLPTFIELGYPELQVTIWFGFLAPAGTPKPIVEALSKDIGEVLKDPEYRSKLTEYILVGTSPEEFAAHIKSEIPKWKKILGVAGIQPR